MKHSPLRLGAASAACLLAAAPAGAAVCTVQSNGVAFGNYDTLDPSPLDGAGSLSVQCDAATSFTVDLGPGAGSINERVMTGPGGTLDYNLYTDATGTAVWGDGVIGLNLSASGSDVILTIYGSIPARQNVEPGAYSDNVTVTVHY